MVSSFQYWLMRLQGKDRAIKIVKGRVHGLYRKRGTTAYVVGLTPEQTSRWFDDIDRAVYRND